MLHFSRRLVVSLQDPSKSRYMELYYWSITSLGALLWLFFEDVDDIEGWTRPVNLLLASKPRRAITPSHLKQTSYALKSRPSALRNLTLLYLTCHAVIHSFIEFLYLHINYEEALDSFLDNYLGFTVALYIMKISNTNTLKQSNLRI